MAEGIQTSPVTEEVQEPTEESGGLMETEVVEAQPAVRPKERILLPVEGGREQPQLSTSAGLSGEWWVSPTLQRTEEGRQPPAEVGPSMTGWRESRVDGVVGEEWSYTTAPSQYVLGYSTAPSQYALGYSTVPSQYALGYSTAPSQHTLDVLRSQFGEAGCGPPPHSLMTSSRVGLPAEASRFRLTSPELRLTPGLSSQGGSVGGPVPPVQPVYCHGDRLVGVPRERPRPGAGRKGPRHPAAWCQDWDPRSPTGISTCASVGYVVSTSLGG